MVFIQSQKRIKWLDVNIMIAELIKSWIVRVLGEGKNQPAHWILRGRLSRKAYLLFRFSIILRYFWKSKSQNMVPVSQILTDFGSNLTF